MEDRFALLRPVFLVLQQLIQNFAKNNLILFCFNFLVSSVIRMKCSFLFIFTGSTASRTESSSSISKLTLNLFWNVQNACLRKHINIYLYNSVPINHFIVLFSFAWNRDVYINSVSNLYSEQCVYVSLEGFFYNFNNL